jgi:hypothetical protein
MTEAAITLPKRASYTVDDLFEIPDDGHRYEVFGGSLLMSPAAAPLHQVITDELRTRLNPLVRPHSAYAVAAVTIRITDEDGPIPDVAVLAEDTRIPCYWRVELNASRRYQGPLPLIVVRVLEKDGETWRTVEAPAGQTHDLPLAVGPNTWITVTLDPAGLVAL